MDTHDSSGYGSHSRRPLLTVRDVARELRVSESTVRRLAASGTLPVARLGGIVRFTAESVDHLINVATTPNDEGPGLEPGLAEDAADKGGRHGSG